MDDKTVNKKTKAKSQNILELSREQIAERLRREVTKSAQMVAKLLSVMDSLRKEIPEEGNRISASLKAMERAAGVKKDRLMSEADNQRQILKKQKKLFSQALDSKREELKNASMRAKDLMEKIDSMKTELSSLQDEHKRAASEALNGDEMIKQAEKRMNEAAKLVDDEIVGIMHKIEHHEVIKTSSAPSEEKVKTIVSNINFDAEGTSPMEEAASAESKPCPQCGGPLAWYELYEKWGCYSCGYQED
jgi:chromosome segregation ATPase